MDKETWNKFIFANSGSFLQSWEWGEFQRAFGRRVFRLAGEDWQAQFIEMTAPVINKKYWYAPRGPVIANSQEPIANGKIQEFVDKIKVEAQKEDVMFWRIGPGWKLANDDNFKKLGFKKLHYDIEPSQTLILELDEGEEELLGKMHEKWRYNIRLAERKGVKVKFTSSDDVNFEQYFEEFYRLGNESTSERKNIKHHPKEYYRKQLEISGDLKMKLFVAEYENKIIAANILSVFGGTATYLHGATSSEHREVMAPHLLQWEQIEYAKSLGCTKYDFWGIVNEHTLDKRGESWEGFTRFKKGFGGYEVNYVGYFDYPLSILWHLLYRLVQKFRR